MFAAVLIVGLASGTAGTGPVWRFDEIAPDKTTRTDGEQGLLMK
jgi:hypothetical protein